MKKLALILAMAAIVLSGMVSCRGEKDDYMKFVGDWGLRELSYYNIDYAGNPIPYTLETYYFTPGDKVDGIDLVFRSDKTGVMIDRSRDTVYVQMSADENDIDTIVCPDTVIYYNFTFSYDPDVNLLYMNMEYIHTYSMQIEDVSDTAFTYYNEYKMKIMEKARMVRLTDSPTREASKGARKPTFIPRRSWSLMSH